MHPMDKHASETAPHLKICKQPMYSVRVESAELFLPWMTKSDLAQNPSVAAMNTGQACQTCHLSLNLHRKRDRAWHKALPPKNSALQEADNMKTICISLYQYVAPVPHKAVAEVSKIGNYRRGEWLWCMDGRTGPLMDRKVVGVVLFGRLPWSPHPQLLDVLRCSVV